MARRIEILANLAFMVLCIVGIVLGVQAVTRPASVAANSGPVPPTARTLPPLYEPGDKLTIDGVDFKAANKTLLLVIRSTCRFCTESMPFYKTLMAARSSQARIVALTPETVEVGAGYLGSHGVQLDAVVSTPLTAVKVRGTPTAILVSNAGSVEKVWQGRLDSKSELEVIAGLRER